MVNALRAVTMATVCVAAALWVSETIANPHLPAYDRFVFGRLGGSPSYNAASDVFTETALGDDGLLGPSFESFSGT